MKYIYDFNNLERDNEIYFKRFEEVTKDLFEILENYQKCINDTKNIISIQDNIKIAIKESNIFKLIIDTKETIIKFKKKDLDDLFKLINRLYINKLLKNDFTNSIIENIENADEFIYYHNESSMINLINTCLMEELSINHIEFIDEEQLIISLSNKSMYLLNHPKASRQLYADGTWCNDTVLKFPETFFTVEVMKCTYSVLTQHLSILIMNIIKIDSDEQSNHIVNIIILRSHFNRIIDYIDKIKDATGSVYELNSDYSFTINKFKSLINKLLIDKYYLKSLIPKEKRELYIDSITDTDDDYKIISLSNKKDKK